MEPFWLEKNNLYLCIAVKVFFATKVYRTRFVMFLAEVLDETEKILTNMLKTNPKFKRAWGCLSVAFVKVENSHISKKAI
jgi:hypothetical protein